MEVIIESGFLRIIEDANEAFNIITLSSTVLHAWQMLEKEKALCTLKGLKQYSITCIDKKIENKGSSIFLLMLRRSSCVENEVIWVQSLETIPNNYLNLPLKIAI